MTSFHVPIMHSSDDDDEESDECALVVEELSAAAQDDDGDGEEDGHAAAAAAAAAAGGGCLNASSECGVCLEPYAVMGEEGDAASHRLRRSITGAGGEASWLRREPYLLHCGHSFCQECVEHCALHSRPQRPPAIDDVDSPRFSQHQPLLALGRSGLFGSLFPSTPPPPPPPPPPPLSSFPVAPAEAATAQVAKVSVVCPICRRSTTYDPAAGPVGGLAKNFELIHAIRVIHSLSEAAANAMGERKKKRKLLALGDGRRGSRDSSRTDVKRRRSEHMKMKEKKEWRGADEMELSQASSSATKAWRTLVIEEEEEEEEEEGQGKPGIMDNGGSPTTALDSSRGDSSFFTVSTPLVSFQPVFTVSFLNSRSASIPRHGDDRSSACLHAEDTNMRPAPLGDGPQLDSHGDEPDNSQSSSIASGVADGNNEAENVYATLPSAPPAHLFEDEEEQLVHSPRITCSLLSSAFPTDGETNQAQLASGDTHSPSAPLYSAFKGQASPCSLRPSKRAEKAGSFSLPEPGHASWIEHSPACMLCQAAFGLFVRQRRCHHCGGLFCFKYTPSLWVQLTPLVD